MGTLLDLVATLTTAPKATAAPLVEVTRAPAANDAQAAPEPPHATIAAPAAPTPASAAESAPEATSESQHIIRTAATASPEWLKARDQYIGHLMACSACYAPLGRHCGEGSDLRQRYDSTPLVEPHWRIPSSSGLFGASPAGGELDNT